MVYVLSTVAMIALSILGWRKATPQLRSISGEFDGRLLLITSFPLLWVTLIEFSRQTFDTFSVGIGLDNSSVGVYATASRITILVSFTVVAMNVVIAPRFAELYTRGEIAVLRSLKRLSVLGFKWY